MRVLPLSGLSPSRWSSNAACCWSSKIGWVLLLLIGTRFGLASARQAGTTMLLAAPPLASRALQQVADAMKDQGGRSRNSSLKPSA